MNYRIRNRLNAAEQRRKQKEQLAKNKEAVVELKRKLTEMDEAINDYKMKIAKFEQIKVSIASEIAASMDASKTDISDLL